jgi:hypothetical protein
MQKLCVPETDPCVVWHGSHEHVIDHEDSDWPTHLPAPSEAATHKLVDHVYAARAQHVKLYLDNQ